MRLGLQRMHAIHLHALSLSTLLAVQLPRRSMSQQGIDRRLDSAGDAVLGPARRQGISRTALAGFDSALPVIYSAQASEAAVSPCRLALVTIRKGLWRQYTEQYHGSHRSALLRACCM